MNYWEKKKSGPGEGEEGSESTTETNSFPKRLVSCERKKVPRPRPGRLAQREKPFCGRSAVRLRRGVWGTGWLTTSHGGNAYRVAEIKSIAQLCALFLPRSPGFGLTLRAHNARELQLSANDISVSSPRLRDFFKWTQRHGKSPVPPSLAASLVAGRLPQGPDPSPSSLPAPPVSSALGRPGAICHPGVGRKWEPAS